MFPRNGGLRLGAGTHFVQINKMMTDKGEISSVDAMKVRHGRGSGLAGQPNFHAISTVKNGDAPENR